jgi:hypothetical protein
MSEAWRGIAEVMSEGEWTAYLTGVCHAITGVEAAVILSFLHRVRRGRDEQEVTTAQVDRIEELVYAGQLGQAHAVLKKDVPVDLPEDHLVSSVDISHAIIENGKDEEAMLQCQHCSDSIHPQDVAVLECGHLFHRLCLRSIIDAQMGIEPLALECPICSAALGREDLALAFAKGEIDQIERKVKKSGDVIMHCPSLGCRFKGKWSVEQFFFCSECEKYYCLICCSELPSNESSKYHLCRGATAEDEATYRKLCNGEEIKQCSQCGYWNEVTSNHRMTCICGKECCTRCLERACKCQRKTGLSPMDWIYSMIS